MATCSIYQLLRHLRRRDPTLIHFHTLKLFLPTTLALATSLLILLYISSTSTLFFIHPQISPREKPITFFTLPPQKFDDDENDDDSSKFLASHSSEVYIGNDDKKLYLASQSQEIYVNEDDKKLYHEGEDIFLENYKEMNRTFKIYIYPHKRNDPYASVLLPVSYEPEGNYASESYFKKVLWSSHFITKDPSKADLFFLPFSIARMRHDAQVGVNGIQGFIRDYVLNITQKYPYWNQSGGSDHFYVACHSIGRTAMDKVVEVKHNAIQIVCSSSYYQSSYVAHKDASLPQIWPRQGTPKGLDRERTKLAFFAGSMNSPVRTKLLEAWKNDSEISVHNFGELTTSYSDNLLSSKFCLHVKGFEVNTARIGDAIHYGCVPVIIANHYDLPFQDILNWNSFSIVVATLDIPILKKILRGVSEDEYLVLHRNVLKVRKHFQWHRSPVDYDAFYMTMYELWIRRSSSRIKTLLL